MIPTFLAQIAPPEWWKLVEGITSTGLIAFIVWYVFSRQMPAREEAARASQTDARKDFLVHLGEARTSYLGSLNDMREGFLTEMERQRGFYKETIFRILNEIEKQGELLRSMQRIIEERQERHDKGC